MARSVEKGPYVEEKLVEKIKRVIQSSSRTAIKTWSRRSVITPEFVGLTFTVYNGRKFLPVYVTESMVGHKLGEFAPTRTFRKHGAHTEQSQDKT